MEVLFKEYETLRAEILTAMNSRNSILSFGLAVIGAIFAASIATFKNTSDNLLSSLILIFLVPLINSFVLFIWLGEYQRMQRAGKFISELEQRINTEAKSTLLTWETELRKQRLHMSYPYDTTVLLITMLSLTSIIFGLITTPLSICYKYLFVGIAILFNLSLYTYFYKKMIKIRS